MCSGQRSRALLLLVGLVALGLVWLARASAPHSPAAPVSPGVVTVQPGDTLWAIATRVAPNADPQAEVDRLMRVNHLRDAGLVPGQQVRVP
jgi:LysM repeat protein